MGSKVNVHLDVVEPDGDRQRVDMGPNNTVLTSNGPTVPPSFRALETGDLDTGVFTPTFSLLVGYSGVPVTSDMKFTRTNDHVEVRMTVFAIATPVAITVCTFDFDLPIDPGADFVASNIVGHGSMTRPATMVGTVGYVTQVGTTRRMRWRTRNTGLSFVGVTVQFSFIYKVV